jgi:antitoxin (DNA-binding transcriptional repressor) of toxin-antitoxin stability system
MLVIGVGEFKSKFSEMLKRAQNGEEIGIAFGKNKEVVARLVPKTTLKKGKRKLGIWAAGARVKFKEGFKMTEQEFLGS